MLMNDFTGIAMCCFSIIGMITTLVLIVNWITGTRHKRTYDRDKQISDQIKDFSKDFSKQNIKNLFFLLGVSIDRYGIVLKNFIYDNTFDVDKDLSSLSDSELNEILK